MPMQYTTVKKDNFQMENDVFLIFAQNIYCGYKLELPLNEPVLTSTHNLHFRAKIRKTIYIPVNPSLLYKRGFEEVYKLHWFASMMTNQYYIS